MPPKTLCSLCISTCVTFKSLYNDDGQLNEIYHMAVNYFDPLLLKPGKYHTSSVICIDCWQHIRNFHTFQQTVINTQSQMEYFEPIVHLTKLDQRQIEIIGSGKICPIEQIGEVLLKESKVTVQYDSVSLQKDAFIAKCKGMPECIVCHEIFATYSLLSDHFHIEHPEKEYNLNCCNPELSTRQKLMADLQQFHNQTEKRGTYECELCSESFSQNSFLNRHYRHVHKCSDRHSYKCDICGRPFSQAFSLKKHIILKHKGHTPPQWICQLCNRKFKFQLNLEKHVEQIHSNVDLSIEKPIKIESPVSLMATNSFVKNYTDNKTQDLVESMENKISTNVKIKHEELFGDSNDKIVHNSALFNKDNNEFMLEDALANENQIIDITDSNQFVLGPEYPQNEIHMPPLDIVDIKDELSLEHDNESNIEPSECIASPLNDTNNMKIRNSQIHREKKELEHDAFIAKHKGDLECPLCKGLHGNYSLLRQHFRNEHTGENCYITCCQLKLISRFRIFEHLQFHIDPKAYQCDVCGKCFKNTGSVVLHKQLVHIEKQSSNHHYLCRCKRSKELYAIFENKEITNPTKEVGYSNLSRDLINQKYYKLVCCQLKQRMLRNDATIAKWNSELYCRICDAKFSSYSLLRDHFCSNHPQDNFYIICCHRKFYKIVDFLDHIRIHLAANVIKCQICNEYLTGKSSLVTHMSTTHKDLPSIPLISSEIKLNKTNSYVKEFDGETNKHNESPEDLAKLGKQHEINDIPLELSENIGNADKRRRLEFDEYITKWKGHLDCIICKGTFASYSLLRKHFSDYHRGQEVHIVCCNRKITKRCKIVEHIRKYHNHIKNLHKCKMCNASFPQYIKLRRHYFQVHHPRDKYEFKCETCGAGFKQRTSLRKHVHNRHADKNLSRWLCKQCNRSFKIQVSLENHMRKFHANIALNSTLIRRTSTEHIKEIAKSPLTIKENSLNNEISQQSSPEIPAGSMTINDEIQCELDTEKIANMEADLRAITSTRNKHSNPFLYDDFISKWKGDLECPECKESFIKYSLLSEHFRWQHPKDRCYIICCKMFLLKIDAIVEHIRTHINPKVYQCDICGKSYKKAQSLGRHKSEVHTDLRSTDRRYLCHCNKAMELYAKKETFNNQASTASSMTTQDALNNQSDVIKCCQRNQKMLENDDIIAKWYPQLDCRICKESFSYYSLLRAHFYYKHPQEKCYIICCQRNFYKTLDALDHIRIHLDPYAFKCDLCNIPLSAKSSLKRHMREMHGEAQKWNCDKCCKTYKHLKTLTSHIRTEHSNLKSYT